MSRKNRKNRKHIECDKINKNNIDIHNLVTNIIRAL
jgi:hypothetical protein